MHRSFFHAKVCVCDCFWICLLDKMTLHFPKSFPDVSQTLKRSCLSDAYQPGHRSIVCMYKYVDIYIARHFENPHARCRYTRLSPCLRQPLKLLWNLPCDDIARVNCAHAAGWLFEFARSWQASWPRAAAVALIRSHFAWGPMSPPNVIVPCFVNLMLAREAGAAAATSGSKSSPSSSSSVSTRACFTPPATTAAAMATDNDGDGDV